jgi:hypothetical protein
MSAPKTPPTATTPPTPVFHPRIRRLARDTFGSVVFVLVGLFLLSQIVLLALLDLF